MNTAIMLIGIAIFAGGVVLCIVSAVDAAKKFKGLKYLCLVVGAVLILAGNCFTIVPTGYSGVRTTFGQISETTVNKGFNIKIPFIQNIELVNNKQQDVKVDTEVWGETTEKTPVFASDINITYQISSSKSAWIYANVSDPDNLMETSLISSAIKSAMVSLSANDVTNREKIEPLVKEKLQTSLDEKYGEGTVTVLKTVINNMDFEDSYNNAIAEKSIAQQNYEKQKIQNDTAIEKAEADKKVAIAEAEANAEATRIEAEAQAEANKLLEKSLTDAVLRSKFYEKWDGQLPQVMGDNAVITDVVGEE